MEARQQQKTVNFILFLGALTTVEEEEEVKSCRETCVGISLPCTEEVSEEVESKIADENESEDIEQSEPHEVEIAESPDSYAGLTEEEKDAKMEEEVRIAKAQKVTEF